MVPEKIYQINWPRLVRDLIPVRLRGLKMLAWTNSFAAPFRDLHSRFLNFRDFTNYWLSITPQVCRLEKALNDRYDIASRRIRIEDATERLGFPLFLLVENKPVVLKQKDEGSPVIMYTKDETGQFTVDFIVKVPVQVAFDLAEMTAFVKSMKLASKTFQIVIV